MLSSIVVTYDCLVNTNDDDFLRHKFRHKSVKYEVNQMDGTLYFITVLG